MTEDEKKVDGPLQAGAPTEEKKGPDEADLQERLKGFNEEIGPLLAKYELGLGAMPKILKGGTLGADPVIVSVRGREEQLKQQTKPEEKITNPEA